MGGPGFDRWVELCWLGVVRRPLDPVLGETIGPVGGPSLAWSPSPGLAGEGRQAATATRMPAAQEKFPSVAGVHLAKTALHAPSACARKATQEATNSLGRGPCAVEKVLGNLADQPRRSPHAFTGSGTPRSGASSLRLAAFAALPPRRQFEAPLPQRPSGAVGHRSLGHRVLRISAWPLPMAGSG